MGLLKTTVTTILNCFRQPSWTITLSKSGHETAKVSSLRTCVSSWIGQMGENLQFEEQKPQSAENQPPNCQRPQIENVAVKLPKSAFWVHKMSVFQTAKFGSSMFTSSNFQIWQGCLSVIMDYTNCLGLSNLFWQYILIINN